MRIERELMRGAGPVAVLKLLEKRDMYGYELAEALAAKTSGVLDMGQSTLYPLLYNLEGKGLIGSYWQSAPSSDRDRKYYHLTREGRKRLATDSEQWRAVAQAMAALGVVKLLAPAFAPFAPTARIAPTHRTLTGGDA